MCSLQEVVEAVIKGGDVIVEIKSLVLDSGGAGVLADGKLVIMVRGFRMKVKI